MIVPTIDIATPADIHHVVNLADGDDGAANSTHVVEVVPVTLEPHPNADSLSIVRVFSGYVAIVRTADWLGVDCGAYVPPDSVVPATGPFEFLGQHRPLHRIKCVRLRGVMSHGLLVHAPEGAQIGDNVADALGVTHYVPPMKGEPGVGRGPSAEAIPAPPGVVAYKYDLEAWRRYGRAFVEGESVLISEKVHGANARYTYSATADAMFCSSRTEWKARSAGNVWWRVLAATPAIEAWCRAHPDDVLYGEAYGAVQDLRYGCAPGEVRFAAFDILRRGEWVDARDIRAELAQYNVPLVPLIYHGPYDAALIEALADGPSLIPGADHVREGVVVKPERERRDDHFGRVALKLVSAEYLSRAA